MKRPQLITDYTLYIQTETTKVVLRSVKLKMLWICLHKISCSQPLFRTAVRVTEPMEQCWILDASVDRSKQNRRSGRDRTTKL